LAGGGLREAVVATTRISRWRGIAIIIGITRRAAVLVGGTTTRARRKRPTATIISVKLMNLKLHWGKRRRAVEVGGCRCKQQQGTSGWNHQGRTSHG
jgi:hypothetical protein